MSEYIHEIVLQDYFLENIEELNIQVQYGKTSKYVVKNVTFNRSGTFWDINGILSNGVQIPIEIEWISSNFVLHRHDKSKDILNFRKNNGVLVVLRKNREIENIQQVSILESLTESKFIKHFKNWYKNKYEKYIDITLKDYLVGEYARNIPRIILYPISLNARKNYFKNKVLYKKHPHNPNILGFTENGYKNVFIKDIKPNDICLFIDAKGKRCTRSKFITEIKNENIELYQLTAYRMSGSIKDRRTEKLEFDMDDLYWHDEIKNNEMIYPYVCLLEEYPFFNITEKKLPFIKEFNDDKWELIRSCIQYGEYKEMSALDFTYLISNL